MLLLSFFISISESIFRLQKQNSSTPTKQETKWNDMRYDISYASSKICMKEYISHTGYELVSSKPTCNNKILKIRRLL